MIKNIIFIFFFISVSSWASKPAKLKDEVKTSVSPLSGGAVYVRGEGNQRFSLTSDAKVGHLRTGVMRFPQMDQHWALRKAKTKRVLLLGAGLMDDGTIPQLHELQARFPGAQITVIDKEPKIGEAIRTSFYPYVLHHGANILLWPKNFDAGASGPTDDIIQRRHRQFRDALLAVPDELNLKNIRFVLGNLINLDKLLVDERPFDVIVATNSIAYALMEAADPVLVGTSLFNTLSTKLSSNGGSLYLDEDSYTALCIQTAASRIAAGSAKIEHVLLIPWSTLFIDVPHEDPVTNSDGSTGTRTVYKRQAVLDYGSYSKRDRLSTGNIVAITKNLKGVP